jgi:uncharacterized protein
MDDLLFQYNPWWEQAHDTSMVRPRDVQVDAILARMSEKRILFLSGLRRVGKTTLMRLVVERLIAANTPPRDIFYVSLDDYLLRGHSLLDVVSAYRSLHKLSVDRRVFLLFDEIASQDDFQRQLKNLLDRERVSIIASASSASLLRDQKAFLTGRSMLYEVQPLNFPEYLTFKGIELPRRDSRLLDRYFRDYIREGGMPEHVLGGGREYLMGLVEDIVQKDIVAFHGLKDQQVLRDFFTLLMERGGKQVSVNKISKILKISPDTARRYLGFFEETYLVHLVPRWGTTNERILSPKKVYACDLGMKHLFIGNRDLGSYFENYVYLRIRKYQPVFYFKEQNVEIDFITQDGTLIEAKYNAAMEGRQQEVFDNHPARRKYVIDSVRSLAVIDELWDASPEADVVKV